MSKIILKGLISHLNQNDPNFEIITVDDNSTDNTLIKMKKVQQKYLYLQHQKNILYSKL